MSRPTNQYLRFHETQQKGKKTKEVYVLASRNDAWLGEIKWYGPWRCYAFFPGAQTVFNHGCLKTINEYIEQLMDERKKARS